FRDLGEQRLKDLDRPVRLHQLEIDGLPSDFQPLRGVSRDDERPEAAAVARPRHRDPRLLVPFAVVAATAAVAPGGLLARGGSSPAQAAAGVAADSVGVFDTKTGKLVAQTPVRAGPTAVATGLGSIWVANVNGDSVSQIDPKTNVSVQTIPVGNAPSGIATGG